MKRLFLSSLIILLMLEGAKAQQGYPGFFSANAHYGFIIPHRASMQHLITGHFTGYEFCYGKASTGDKKWTVPFHLPDYGLSFLYTNLGNDAVLGKAVGLYPFVNFPLHRTQNTLLSFRFGSGLGWITKPFDAMKNYKNSAIGSHLNALISFRFEENIRITEKLQFTFALSFTHMSNGAYKVPNLGINVPTATSGFIWRFGKKRDLSSGLLNFRDSVRFRLYTTLSGGLKEIYPENGRKFPVLSSSFEISKRAGIKQFWGGGVDIFYDASIHEKYRQKMRDVGADILLTRVGVKASYELVFSNLSFLFQAGVYALTKDKDDGLIYDRLALRYRLSKKLLINLSLKTHIAKADFIELGVGYFINRYRSQ